MATRHARGRRTLLKSRRPHHQSWIHYAERWYPPATMESVDLLDYDLFADHEPWEVFELLQREAPVYRHPEPDGRGFWALTKYDDVLAVLRDTKTYSSEVGGAATIEDLPEDVLAARRNFLEFDPPKHGRYRRLISRQFTPRRGRALRGVAAGAGPLPARHRAAAGRVRPRARARGADPDPRARAHPRAARGDPAPPDRPRRPAAGRHRPRVRRRARLRRRARGVPVQAVRLALGRRAVRDRARVLRRPARLPARRRAQPDRERRDRGRADVRPGPRQHVRAADRGRERDDAAGDQPRDARARRASRASTRACATIAR